MKDEEILLKRCSKCREFKGLECFHNHKARKDGKYPQCKQCRAERYQEHKGEIKQYQEENKERICQQKKKYYQEHRQEELERARKYREEHRQEIIQRCQVYKEKINQRERMKYKTDSYFRLNCLMSVAIRRIKNLSIKKDRSWIKLLPYTLIELKKHLKRTLPMGYSWKDFMQGKLHIDHILPIAIFQYEKAEDLAFQICWGLDNLRLLPAKENRSKSAKLIRPFQKTFAVEIKLRDKCVSSI